MVGHLNPCRRVTATSVTSYVDALRFLKKHPADFILVEHRDGVTSPLEWLVNVRSHSPRVPVALLSGSGGEQLLVEALRENAAIGGSKEDPEQSSTPVLERFLALGCKDGRDHSLAGYMTERETCLTLGNDYKLLTIVSGYLQEELARSRLCSESECIQAGVALSEALTNALYHGNLEVSSSLRSVDDDAYFTLAESRRTQLPYRDRRIYVSARIENDRATFIVRDEGPGFSISSLPDPTIPANLDKGSGRGVLLIRSFMDEVHYNAAGNQVVMIKKARHPVEEAP